MPATIASSSSTSSAGPSGRANAERAYEFQADLARHAQRLRDRVTEAYVNVILLLFMNIVVGGNYSPGTPRDTGFAANSWVVGLNGVGAFRQDAQPSKDERRTPVALASVDDLQQVLVARLEDEVHLTSNCAYMAALEDGHSQQAPTGMVWLAIHAGPQIIEVIVREMLS